MDILEIIHTGQANVDGHDDSACLRDAAERFLAAYGPFEGFSVVAASPQAERVLGAAMMLKPDLSAKGQGSTILLDVNIASGTLLARAARRLREGGNGHELVGIALYALASNSRGWDVPEVSQIVIAGNAESPSLGGWERADAGHDCVMLAG